MDAHTKEKRLLREENARAWSTADAHSDASNTFIDVIYRLVEKLKCVEESDAQKDKQIANLIHRWPYTQTQTHLLEKIHKSINKPKNS